MPEIVTDPEIPGPARRELELAPPAALLGFGGPVSGPGVPSHHAGGPTAAGRKAARRAAAACLVLAVLLIVFGLVTGPAYLVAVGVFVCLPAAGVSAWIGLDDGTVSAPELAGGQGRPLRAAVTYHRRYVVPESDLHEAGLARWRRASEAAKSIQAAEAVRAGLIDTVEMAAVLPYHRWDIAERLALMSATERRLPAILQGVDTNRSDIQAVLGPQRQVHDLAVADVEQRIGRLEEFAALAARADAALRRKQAIDQLAGLNPDYEELLIRLGEAGNALTVTGYSGAQLRALAAEADDAVRRANEAGRALAIPPAVAVEPGT